MNGSRIVIGYDASPGAEQAMAWGLAEAARRHGEAELVYAWTWPNYLPAAAMVPGAPVWPEMAAEREVDAMLAAAVERAHVCLILVGSRGLDGTQAILGSVSDMVVHYATVPVLVVPHPLVQAEYTAIADGPLLIGWDGSAGAAAALAEAGRLFSGRELLAVSLGAPAADLPAGLPETVLSRTSRVTVDAGHGMPGHVVADGLAQCARARSAAAVVVGSRGRSPVAEILLGSAAMATLHRAHRAVVVVPGDRTAGTWART
jgi:nucleotide-binding universal stress UspA family protein